MAALDKMVIVLGMKVFARAGAKVSATQNQDHYLSLPHDPRYNSEKALDKTFLGDWKRQAFMPICKTATGKDKWHESPVGNPLPILEQTSHKPVNPLLPASHI